MTVPAAETRLRTVRATRYVTAFREGGSLPGLVEADDDGRVGQGERFHWLVAPSSTVIQTSECHPGLCDDPGAELDHHFERLVG